MAFAMANGKTFGPSLYCMRPTALLKTLLILCHFERKEKSAVAGSAGTQQFVVTVLSRFLPSVEMTRVASYHEVGRNSLPDEPRGLG